MKFFDLDSQNVSDYILENRSFSGMWFFHHIPKTAGSSLVAELSKNVTPYENIEPSYDDPTTQLYILRNRVVEDFVARMAENPPHSASGHMMPNNIDLIEQQGHPVRFFSFVRHPVERILSEYNYCCSELHPPHKSFMETFPTIEHFIESDGERNKCAQYFVHDPTEPVDVILNRLNERYAMIGLQERYPVSFIFLSSMLYKPSLPTQKERIGKPRDPVDPGLARVIEDANSVDMAIHDAVSEVYGRIARTIWELHRDKALEPEL